MKIERRVSIQAPPEMVWDAITNLRQAKEWAPGFEDYPYISDQWPRQGSSAIWRYHAGLMRMDFRLTIAESNRGRSLKISNRSKLGIGLEDYRFSSANGVTTVDYAATSTLNFLGRLVGPLLKKRLERQVEATTSNLKRYCERKAG